MTKGKLANRTVLASAIVGSLVLLNVLAVAVFGRFNLTSDGRYTLSEASKHTMEELEDPVTVTAYFTKDLPAPYSCNARYVKDLLAEYRAASDGKLRFEFIDPHERRRRRTRRRSRR